MAAWGLGTCPQAGSPGSGRHAEVRLHLGNEAAAAEPRDSASTSRGSLLTLHREEAAAKEEAAPGRPPPRARRSPTGRSRPRRTRLLGSAKPRSGRAALGTAALPAPRRRPLQQRAGCSPGRGPETRGSRRPSTRGCEQLGARGPCAPGDPRDPSESADGGVWGGRSPVPVRGSLLLHTSTPPAPRWRRSCLPLPLPQPPMLARPPLPPWLGAVT